MRIGIDIGGTKIEAGIVDNAGTVTQRKRIPTDRAQGYEAIRDNIVRLVFDIISEAGVNSAKIERIGIACAGQVGRDSNRIIFSPNLGWRNVPLRSDIERACGITTYLDNDVNAATYGEWRFGLSTAPSDVLGIFAGTGIGGGLIINGELYRGFANVGGEVGHMTLNPYGYQCRCGNSGCFEAYCGGAYIVERVRQAIENGYSGRILDIIERNPDALNTGHVEEGWLTGDELCETIWGEVIEYMGAGLASLVNLLNPEVIILGGGVILGSRYLVEEASKVMVKRAMAASIEGLRIERASMGEDAAIVGAAFVDWGC